MSKDESLLTNMGFFDTEEELPRRTFIHIGLGVIGAGYAAAIGYPIYQYLATPAERAMQESTETQTTLEGAEQLPPSSAMMFKFGSKPAMLIHHANGNWVAFGAVCTHLGCTVKYETDQNRIFCACHGGTYDPYTGVNIAGPPPKPLTQYKVEVKDGTIVISRT